MHLALFGEDTLQVQQRLAGLGGHGHIVDEFACRRVQRNLPGHEDEVTGADRLGIGSDRRRTQGSRDHFLVHHRTIFLGRCVDGLGGTNHVENAVELPDPGDDLLQMFHVGYLHSHVDDAVFRVGAGSNVQDVGASV